MINLRDVEFLYEPYPIGLARGVFEENYYNQLVNTFPSYDNFVSMEYLGKKYSLSELNNPDIYNKYIASSKPWREFHKRIKSKDFIKGILDVLESHNIDLGVYDYADYGRTNLLRFKNNLRFLFGRSQVKNIPKLSARFEFSMLPADGGHIKPHTDSPNKVITLVIPIIREGEWNYSWGGGTEVMKPKDITRNFNLLNKQLEFDDVETIKTFEFFPNQCLIFIKTFNSLHAVSPMKGYGSNFMRSTLTVNIEVKN
jgi:hypothetical protein